MNNRIRTLREKMINAEHASFRLEFDGSVSFSKLPLSLPERRAHALAYIFENMPVYIGDGELIVGARTFFSPVASPECDSTVVPSGKSLLDLDCMPEYLSDGDRERFRGFDIANCSLLHNVADYSIILKYGIDGIISKAENAAGTAKSEFRAEYSRAMVIVYRAFSSLIKRYADEALRLVKAEQNETRRTELRRISEICAHIASEPPRDYYEAAQLFWFAHIGVLCDNFRGMSYGRVDQFLYPYYDSRKHDEIKELTACLLIKFSDCCDLYHYQMGQYNSQHNITLGGVTPDGEDAVNELTYIFIDALDAVRLEEPEVACRISTKNPPEYLDKLTALSETGLNTLAYYNDDQFVKNLTNAGIPRRDAMDYAFDLCQDIMIPGRCGLYRSADINLTSLLLDTLSVFNGNTFEDFSALYEKVIAEKTDDELKGYYKFEKMLTEFATGDTDAFYSEDIKDSAVISTAANLMTPLSFTSAMIEGGADNGGDVNLLDYRLRQRGVMISGLVVAVNSMASLRKWVFDEKKFTIDEIREALKENFADREVMRQTLMSAPRWGNDDDYADIPGVRIMEFTARTIQKYRTYSGVRHLAGFHQPHPVFAGWNTPATPDGRLSGTPIPVSLSPAAGSMKNGATAAMRSVAKLPCELSEWNNCLMLEYSSAIFAETEGILSRLIRSYFKIGGMQHQPNSVNREELKAAQNDPEAHKDLIIRMWGVSARFVTLSREVQDEFISRLE